MRGFRPCGFGARTLLAGVSLAIWGCGEAGLRSDEVDLEEMRPVFDFAERLPSAQVFHEVAFIDLGTPSSGRYLGSGWDQPEVVPDSGMTFVWVVAPSASLDTFLLRTDYAAIDFRCWPFTWEGAPPQLVEVRINGTVLGSLRLKKKLTKYSVRVPEGVLLPGRNRIELAFAYAQRPVDQPGGGSDHRTLAAAFDFIGFRGASVAPDGVAGERAPEVRDGVVIIPRGVGLSYTVMAEGEVVLDLGLVAEEEEERGAVSQLVVWTRRGEELPRQLLSGTVGQLKGKYWTYRLEAGEGLLEIGFGSPIGRDPTMGAGSLAVHGPQLYTSDSRVELISNVLLIVVDTLRADHVGVYGGEAATPNIDALAARGVTFRRAFAHIPITGPSHATLFTSRLPFEHGVHNNTQVLDAGLETLAEVLRQAGRNTLGVVSLGVLKGRFGFDRGFDTYLDAFGYDWMKDAEEVNREALELVGGGLGEPFFFWVHFSDPHEPYAPPGIDYQRIAVEAEGRMIGELTTRGRAEAFALTLSPGANRIRFVPRDPEKGRTYRFTIMQVDARDVEVRLTEGWRHREKRVGSPSVQTRLPAVLELVNPSSEPRDVELRLACKMLLDNRELRERYAMEVTYVDRQIGVLLANMEERGLLENTLVIFASDHGESLGDHNHVGHISQLYDTLVRVPLIVAYPGRLVEGAVVEEQVGLVDVLPTVIELLGLPEMENLSGSSLVGLMGGEEGPRRPVFAATYRPEAYSDKRAIIADGFKYIRSWTDEREWEELYDLAADPEELDDLAEARPEVLERLRSVLDARLSAATGVRVQEAALTEDEVSQLRALGYVH